MPGGAGSNILYISFVLNTNRPRRRGCGEMMFDDEEEEDEWDEEDFEEEEEEEE